MQAIILTGMLMALHILRGKALGDTSSDHHEPSEPVTSRQNDADQFLHIVLANRVAYI